MPTPLVQPLADELVELWSQGLTITQIAEQLGLAPGTVSSGISRLRREGYNLPRRSRGLRERFEAKVERGGPEECWEWRGGLTTAGYGHISVDGTSRYAHRVALALEGRPPSPRLQVDHLCRNRACVNPRHLEVVTQQENVRRQSNIKLTPQDVEAIRSAAGSNESLAAAFGVSSSHISRVRRGERW